MHLKPFNIEMFYFGMSNEQILFWPMLGLWLLETICTRAASEMAPSWTIALTQTRVYGVRGPSARTVDGSNLGNTPIQVNFPGEGARMEAGERCG
jgi:hypothetical protein